MPARQLPTLALAVVIVAACTTPDRGATNDTSASRASANASTKADTTPVTTHDMVDALVRDRKDAERQLTAVEDSVWVFMGDSVATLLRQAHTSWEQYRKLECDAIKVAFSDGTMAPVAQLECWVDLTDDHRRFIAEEYDYLRNGGLPPGRQPR